MNWLCDRRRLLSVFTVLAVILVGGCSKKDDGGAPQITTPQQAATHIEQSFNASPDPALKQYAKAASDALREGDYEKAVVSLTAVRSSDKVTIDQGLTVHGTTVMLESKLIQAIESGDPKAKRAYELLKAMKRK